MASGSRWKKIFNSAGAYKPSGAAPEPDGRPMDATDHLDSMITRLLEQRQGRGGSSFLKPLAEPEVVGLIERARSILLQQPSLLELDGPEEKDDPPLWICGDIHGQFADLLRLFELCGWPPSANYVFLGDYVDRGSQSFETIMLLLAFKVKYPLNFFLLRGNHECYTTSKIYGFWMECRKRYSKTLWDKFIECFDCLPPAAVIDGKIFCCHGGISPSVRTLDDIRNIERPCDIDEEGILCDLCWSDPNAELPDKGWADSDRGAGYLFGQRALRKWLDKHKLELLVRAHQVVEAGYEFFADRSCLTIFSAPNYAGEFDNNAAMLRIGPNLKCSIQVLCPPDPTMYCDMEIKQPPPLAGIMTGLAKKKKEGKSWQLRYLVLKEDGHLVYYDKEHTKEFGALPLAGARVEHGLGDMQFADEDGFRLWCHRLGLKKGHAEKEAGEGAKDLTQFYFVVEDGGMWVRAIEKLIASMED